MTAISANSEMMKVGDKMKEEKKKSKKEGEEQEE